MTDSIMEIELTFRYTNVNDINLYWEDQKTWQRNELQTIEETENSDL